MPADAYVDLGAVGFDLTRLHTGREGVDAILMSVVVHRLTPGLKGTWMSSPRGSDGAAAVPLTAFEAVLIYLSHRSYAPSWPT
jgi:hypothetical protein